jgi:hypothetical protein
VCRKRHEQRGACDGSDGEARPQVQFTSNCPVIVSPGALELNVYVPSPWGALNVVDALASGGIGAIVEASGKQVVVGQPLVFGVEAHCTVKPCGLVPLFVNVTVTSDRSSAVTCDGVNAVSSTEMAIAVAPLSFVDSHEPPPVLPESAVLEALELEQ